MAIPLVAGVAGLVTSAVTSIVGRFASTATTLAVLGFMQKAMIVWALFILAPLAFVAVVMYFLQLVVPWAFAFILAKMQGNFPDMIINFTGPAAYLAVKLQIPNILALIASALLLRFFLRLFRVV